MLTYEYNHAHNLAYNHEIIVSS